MKEYFISRYRKAIICEIIYTVNTNSSPRAVKCPKETAEIAQESLLMYEKQQQQGHLAIAKID